MTERCLVMGGGGVVVGFGNGWGETKQVESD